MSNYLEGLWGGASSIFGGGEDVERAPRTPTEMIPEPTIPGQFSPGDLSSPGAPLKLTPEDLQQDPNFGEDFMLYQQGVLGEMGDISLNNQIMMDPTSTPARAEKSRQNLVLGEENRDAMYGDGFYETFMNGLAPDDGLVTTVPRPGNLNLSAE